MNNFKDSEYNAMPTVVEKAIRIRRMSTDVKKILKMIKRMRRFYVLNSERTDQKAVLTLEKVCDNFLECRVDFMKPMEGHGREWMRGKECEIDSWLNGMSILEKRLEDNDILYKLLKGDEGDGTWNFGD